MNASNDSSKSHFGNAFLTNLSYVQVKELLSHSGTIPVQILNPDNVSRQFIVPIVPQHQNNVQDGQVQYLIDAREKNKTLVNTVDDQKYHIQLLNEEFSNLPVNLENKYNKIMHLGKQSKLPNKKSELSENDCNNEEKTNENVNKVTKKDLRKIRQQIKHYVHISDRSVPPRAIAVLPPSLHIRRNNIFPRRQLPTRVRFGPVQGVINKIQHSKANELMLEALASDTPIFLMRKDDTTVTHIDLSDKDKSNWFSLLPLGNQDTANIWLHEEDGELFGIATKSLKPRTRLALGYTRQYAERHKLPTGQPVLDLDEDSSEGPQKWRCYECSGCLPNVVSLQKHMDVCHKEEGQHVLRRYRCKRCTRTFSRLFSLKRHTFICSSRKTENTNNTELPTDVSSLRLNDTQTLENTTHNPEENRVPSDESFQNYTNNLDFSTSLFDTDRIPSLDMSGSSRSDNEFNPYSMDNVLSNDLGFINGTDASYNSPSNENAKTQNDEPILISCPHCSQTVDRTKLRQHVRVCQGRRFECECGRVFNTKEKLAQHIHSEHPSNSIPNNITSSKSNDMQYNCEVCQHNFKRRGMLVNHMWRAHGKAAGGVPLQRRVRHYPCGVCPKLYRTAAKRDRHLQNHHPGAENIRPQSIEAGKRECEPAACPACPRQYATRAKLLQHMRMHHPQMAPPIRKKFQSR